MPTILGPNGITFSDAKQQTHIEGIVKIGVTSASAQNFNAGTGFGAGWQFVTGAEINMGVPEKPNNWYRIRWQTIADEQGAVAAGTGAAIYRFTPSSGWVRVMDQGHHATLENDVGDLYWMSRVDYLIPVHPSFPTQSHSFRIYHANWNSNCRINCTVNDNLLRNGWNNNLFEVFELDTSVVNSGNLTRF
jgi:hypothetical protein